MENITIKTPEGEIIPLTSDELLELKERKILEEMKNDESKTEEDETIGSDDHNNMA